MCMNMCVDMCVNLCIGRGYRHVHRPAEMLEKLRSCRETMELSMVMYTNLYENTSEEVKKWWSFDVDDDAANFCARLSAVEAVFHRLHQFVLLEQLPMAGLSSLVTRFFQQELLLLLLLL